MQAAGYLQCRLLVFAARQHKTGLDADFDCWFFPIHTFFSLKVCLCITWHPSHPVCGLISTPRKSETRVENVFIPKSHGWTRLYPSLSPSVSETGISLAFRETLLHRCVNQYSGLYPPLHCNVQNTEHEKKVRCINFASGVRTLIRERNSCLKDILRNTWWCSNKCEWFSLHFEVQSCRLRSQ